MAGIGFELRKLLKEDSLLSYAKLYGYSAILSSGPWVISIIAILLVGFINLANLGETSDAFRFQVVVTYAIALASSLIVTGVFQLPFTRYIADLIFQKREEEVLPTYFGAIFLSWVLGLPFIFPFYLWVFEGLDWFFVFSAIATFLILCAVWISSILAASLKYYKEVVYSYLISYGLIVYFSYYYGSNIGNLMFIYFLGNAILLLFLMTFIIKSYNSTIFLKLDFFLEPNFYWSLGIAGLAYNLGAWVDKFIFWYHSSTGHAVIGKLHASVVYDMPIFLAYFSIIPGMAIFFYRLEADFADKYDLFYSAVRDGGTLEVIHKYQNDMIEVVRHAVHEILMVQGIVDIILFLSAPKLFELLNIPQLYLGLLFILSVGSLLQLAFMSILAILHYLNRRKQAMWLSIAFFVLNGILSYLSIGMGPSFFGYGYTVSLLIVFIMSLYVIRNEMDRIDYETFMLQK